MDNLGIANLLIQDDCLYYGTLAFFYVSVEVYHRESIGHTVKASDIIGQSVACAVELNCAGPDSCGSSVQSSWLRTIRYHPHCLSFCVPFPAHQLDS